MAPIARWRAILARAPEGRFIGVDPCAYPADLATYARYSTGLDRLPRRPLPPRLGLDDLDEFLAGVGARYEIAWTELVRGAGRGAGARPALRLMLGRLRRFPYIAAPCNARPDRC